MTQTTMQLRATKACVRGVFNNNYKVMYLGNLQEKAELVVTTEQTIKYISPSLYRMVVLHRKVKFVNSIATVVLDYENDAIMATFTVRVLDGLVTETIFPQECIDTEMFRALANDQGELCEKSRIYHRIDMELRKQLDNFEMTVVNRSLIDTMLIVMVRKVLKLIDIAMGRLGNEEISNEFISSITGSGELHLEDVPVIK